MSALFSLLLCSSISTSFSYNLPPSLSLRVEQQNDGRCRLNTLGKSAQGIMKSNEWVERMARQALSGLHQQYPHKIDHLWVESDGVLRSPESLHPAFYGNYDWHSSVHSHWALVRILLGFPSEIKPMQAAISLSLEKNINADTCRVEAAYLEGSATFERPYGWGWLLRLAAECSVGAREAEDDDTRALLGRMSSALEPVARAVRNGWLRYLPKLGEHPFTQKRKDVFSRHPCVAGRCRARRPQLDAHSTTPSPAQSASCRALLLLVAAPRRFRFRPPFDALAAPCSSRLPPVTAGYPVRSGVHSCTAFALLLTLDYAAAAADRELAQARPATSPDRFGSG